MTDLQRILPLLAAAALLPGMDGATDFSRAGYRGGDTPIPSPAVVANVRDFGAVGDGETDDTGAFLRALAEAPPGAVLVPSGRYRITGLIQITRSGTVLRGEGADRSILVFTRTLTDVKPNWGATTTGDRTSNYSWSGGFIAVGPADKPPAPQWTAIAAPAARGTRTMELAGAAGLAAGDEVVIALADDQARTLTSYLYAGDTGPIGKLGPVKARQVARIAAIAGTRATLDRPLRYDLRPEWTPRVARYAPRVRECGIEDLGFAFPPTPYAGHFTELGFNGIELRSESADCWVRRVEMRNAESGIYVQGDRATVDGLVLVGDKPAAKERYGGAACSGHHGISVGGSDNLITGFDIRLPYIHDITVEGASCAGNVFAGGRGTDLSFDHHKRVPHANLFTDIDCGVGGRVWFHGGGADLGRPSGAWAVFWNLRGTKRIPQPPADFAPKDILARGLDAPVEPRDLHAAQVAARRAAKD